MTISVNITAEQEAALALSNGSDNPDEQSRPTLDDFIQSVIQQKLNEHLNAWARRRKETIKQQIDSLSDEKLDAVAAVLVAEPSPVVDPVIEPTP